MKDSIRYIDGFKHQLYGSAAYDSMIYIGISIKEKFYEIDNHGFTQGKDGYAWDGASGPTLDSIWTKRGSLFHDIWCQAIGEGLLDPKWRFHADKMFLEILLIDAKVNVPGKYAVNRAVNLKLRQARAKYWYWGVRIGAKRNPGSPTTPYHKIIHAPGKILVETFER